MQVSFENQSSQDIRLTIQGISHVLPSGHKAVLKMDDREPIFAQVDQYKPLRKKDKSYHLVVETEYRLEGLTEGCRILLTRERIALDFDTSYDRVFLHPSEGRIAQEKYQVVNYPDVKHQLKKNELKGNALWPIEDLLGALVLELLFHPIATLICIAIAIGIGIHFGWYWIPIILLGALLIESFICIVLSPAIEKFFAKITGIPTQEETLKKYCTPEALSEFYNQPEREPFAGKPIEY